MADVDAFGLRLGSKVSKAASLAARPRGATMREIVEATGDTGTKYNIFSQLEAKGHIVRREGGRIFLKHKDAVSTKETAEMRAIGCRRWLSVRDRRMYKY
jgi:hypothetical protein